MTALMQEHEYVEAPAILAPREPVRLPHVNLLPPEIIERRALTKLGRGLSVVVLAAALLAGFLWYEAGSGRDAAQTRVDAAQAAGTKLQAEQTRLAPAQQALAAAQQSQQTLKAAMANEVLWSRYLEEVKLKLPKSARLSNMVLGSASTGAASGTSTPAAGAGTPAAGTSTPAAGATGTSTGTGATGTSGTAAGPAVINSATFTGTAKDQYAVADWLQNLTLVPGFTNPYLTSTTASSATGTASALVTFTVTVDITADALSHRYDDVAGG